MLKTPSQKVDFSASLFKTIYDEYVGIENTKAYCARYWEYGVTFAMADLTEKDLVLDVGGAHSHFLLFLSQFIQQGFILDNATFQYHEQWVKTLFNYDDFINGKVNLIKGDAKELPFKDESFDKVITISAFEHIDGDDDILAAKEVHRVLKNNGFFCGTVDFNPIRKAVHKNKEGIKTYNYDSFMDRIVNPAAFKLFSDYEHIPIPEKTDYIAIPLFFKMLKYES